MRLLLLFNNDIVFAIFIVPKLVDHKFSVKHLLSAFASSNFLITSTIACWRSLSSFSACFFDIVFDLFGGMIEEVYMQFILCLIYCLNCVWKWCIFFFCFFWMHATASNLNVIHIYFKSNTNKKGKKKKKKKKKIQRNTTRSRSWILVLLFLPQLGRDRVCTIRPTEIDLHDRLGRVLFCGQPYALTGNVPSCV